MNVIDQINLFVESVTQNESVAGGLRKSIAKQKAKGFPKTHFFMTELTNPVEAFYHRNNPKFQTSTDLARKLAWGSTLHNLASYWFRKHDDFIVCESTIDKVLPEKIRKTPLPDLLNFYSDLCVTYLDIFSTIELG